MSVLASGSAGLLQESLACVPENTVAAEIAVAVAVVAGAHDLLCADVIEATRLLALFSNQVYRARVQLTAVLHCAGPIYIVIAHHRRKLLSYCLR